LLIQQIKNLTPPGTILEKPDSSSMVLSWGVNRKGEECMTYLFGGRYRKTVTTSEILDSYSELVANDRFTRAWFTANLSSAKSAPCNYTTIGALFKLLGEAEYQRGTYQRVR